MCQRLKEILKYCKYNNTNNNKNLIKLSKTLISNKQSARDWELERQTLLEQKKVLWICKFCKLRVH